MLRFNRVITVFMSSLVPLAAADSAYAEWGLNLPTPVTPIGDGILTLHNWILLISTLIFVGVFSVMFYSIYAHRKSKGHKASQFSHSTFAEVTWTVIPTLILIGMAIPSTAMLIEMEDTSEAELTVKITGYQWKWRYDYLESGVYFYSNLSTDRNEILNNSEKGENYLLEVDREVVLPVGKKIRFLITANDVIHSWWVPQLAVKKDAIPGFINEVWTKIDEPGIYRGQCTELCGREHGFMPVVVRAVSEEEFEAWIAENAPKDEQAGMGSSNSERRMLIAEASVSILDGADHSVPAVR